jgi:hypothetical protein
MSWVKLKDLKASNPIELAEYAVANRIAEEPAFKWWVFDRLAGTDLWTRAINKEMAKVKVAWETRDDLTPEEVRAGKARDMIGFQEIGCHIIFDIKMDFTRKARFVAGGHTTDTPAAMTYSSVVSRESVRLGFLIAALNGLDIMSCDLESAYLNAKCKEKIWFEGGIECGADQGKVLIVVRALYGLKSAGASWRATLAQALRDLGFVSTTADPDVWIRAAVCDDGFEYYEMLLIYVDDILAVSHQPKVLIDAIGEYYKVKPNSDKELEIYLSANAEKVQMPDGREVWSTSPRDYVKNAIKSVESLLEEDGEGYVLKNKVNNPFPMNYRPELEVSDELGSELSSCYLQLIGIARWAIELGRIDIFHEVSLLSQYQVNPRVGHLGVMYHVFAYLKNHLDMRRIAYDSLMPMVNDSTFIRVSELN